MPAASSSSATAKRKQDEKHYNILKDLLAQDCNKKCFDCGQRGPVYVNMTIGAFVCTSCSGLLRGMNTPHRVKSVSMASFTPEEMDFIQKRGNDACYCVWMGRYEASRKFGGGDAFPESKDEHRLREYMHKKYEQKKWYVSEVTALAEYEKIRQKTLAAQKPVEISKNASKPHIPVPLNGNLSQKQAMKGSPNEAAAKKTAPSENKIPTKTTSNSNDLDLIFGTGPSDVRTTQASSVSATNTQPPNAKASSNTQPPKDLFAADPFPSSGASQNDFDDPFSSFQSNADAIKSEQPGFAAFPSSSAQTSFVADFGEMKMSSPAINTTPQNSLNANNSMSSATTGMGSSAVKEDKYAILASLDEEMKSSANKTSWSENMTVKRDPIVSSNQGFGNSAFASPTNYPVSWNSQTPQVSGMTQYTGSPAVYASGGFTNSEMGVNPFGGPLQGSQTLTTSGYAAFGNFSSPQIQQPNNRGTAQLANPFLESSWVGVNNARPAGTNDFQLTQPFCSPMAGVGNTSMPGGISNYPSGAPGFSQSPYSNNPQAIHQHAISTGAPNAMTNGASFPITNQFSMAHQPFGTPQGFSNQNSTISSNFPGQPTHASNFNTMNSPFSVQPNAQNLNLHQHVNEWPVPQTMSTGSANQQPAVDPFASLATGMKSSVQLSTVSTKSPNPWPNQAPPVNPSVNTTATMKANPFLD